MTKVFVSYCHEPNDQFYSERVETLSAKLNEFGVFCLIDKYDPHPSEGWPKWMQKRVSESDFLIIAFSPNYYKRASGDEINGNGLGVKFESTLILNEFYINDSISEKIIPIVLKREDSKFIPNPYRSLSHYDLSQKKGFEMLYRRITNQPLIAKPNTGNIIALDAKEVQDVDPIFSLSQDENSDNKSNSVVVDATADIELKIKGEFESFSPQKQAQILALIAKSLEIDQAEIRIKTIRRGSILLTLELRADLAERLLWAVKSGNFDELDIIDAKIGSYAETKNVKVNVKPLADRVLIEATPIEDKTSFGIFIPFMEKENPPRGTVVAVGSGKKGEPLTVQVGDTVLYGKYSGTEITFDGKDYLIMRESDIYAIL